MNRIIRFFAAVPALAAAFLATSATVVAHHSRSEYDQTTVVDVEGVITKKFWRNPHVMFHVTTTQNGVEEVWVIEGASVTNQKRRGIGSEVINVGDRIIVAGFASTRRENNLAMSNILLPSGEELMMGRGAARRWPEAQSAAVGPTGPSDEAVAQAKATADGLFRVWSWGRLEPGWWFFADPDAFPLTEAALEKFAGWDEYTDNPQLECVPPGMPLTMGNPYPLSFTQVDENTIEMNAHEFDVKRTIHLGAEIDRSVAESHMGYSVGRWEDDNTLVVDTVNINYPYFNRVGISSGPDLETHERFVIDDEEGKLHYYLTVTDPWALTEPFEKELLWIWTPGVEVGSYNCAVED
jgi:hypothetical protein